MTEAMRQRSFGGSSLTEGAGAMRNKAVRTPL
jgi:hypothetical protein